MKNKIFKKSVIGLGIFSGISGIAIPIVVSTNNAEINKTKYKYSQMLSSASSVFKTGEKISNIAHMGLKSIEKAKKAGDYLPKVLENLGKYAKPVKKITKALGFAGEALDIALDFVSLFNHFDNIKKTPSTQLKELARSNPKEMLAFNNLVDFLFQSFPIEWYFNNIIKNQSLSDQKQFLQFFNYDFTNEKKSTTVFWFFQLDSYESIFKMMAFIMGKVPKYTGIDPDMYKLFTNNSSIESKYKNEILNSLKRISNGTNSGGQWDGTLLNKRLLIEEIYNEYNFPYIDLDNPTGRHITSIEANPFEKYTTKFVSLPNTLNSIGDDALKNTQMESLNLKNLKKLYSIGDRAFQNSPVTSLNLYGLSNLRSIGSNSFEKSNIGALDFSHLSGLKKIGANAFENSYIRTINFDGVNEDLKIGDNAFLNSINGIRVYTSSEKVLKYLKDNQDKIFGKYKNIIWNKESDLWFEGKESSGPVIYLPQTQNDQKNWKKFVYFPQHLERINDYAFSNSTAVGTLDLSYTNTLYIGNNAFRDSKFDLMDLSGLMTKAKTKGKTLQIKQNAFASSTKAAKVKISQTDWDELVQKSGKTENVYKKHIFGNNYNYVQIINKDTLGNEIITLEPQIDNMKGIDLFRNIKSVNYLYLTLTDFTLLNKKNIDEKVLSKLSFNFGETTFDKVDSRSILNDELKILGFKKDFEKSELILNMVKLNGSLNPLKFDLKFKLRKPFNESLFKFRGIDCKENKKIEMNHLFKVSGESFKDEWEDFEKKYKFRNTEIQVKKILKNRKWNLDKIRNDSLKKTRAWQPLDTSSMPFDPLEKTEITERNIFEPHKSRYRGIGQKNNFHYVKGLALRRSLIYLDDDYRTDDSDFEISHYLQNFGYTYKDLSGFDFKSLKGYVNNYEVDNAIFSGPNSRWTITDNDGWTSTPIFIASNENLNNFVSLEMQLAYVFDGNKTYNPNEYNRKRKEFRYTHSTSKGWLWNQSNDARGNIKVKIIKNIDGNFEVYFNEEFKEGNIWTPKHGKQIKVQTWGSNGKQYEVANKDNANNQGKTAIAIIPSSEKGGMLTNATIYLRSKLFDVNGEDGVAIWNQKTILTTVKEEAVQVNGFKILNEIPSNIPDGIVLQKL